MLKGLTTLPPAAFVKLFQAPVTGATVETCKHAWTKKGGKLYNYIYNINTKFI
jgi:hypothetical protein